MSTPSHGSVGPPEAMSALPRTDEERLLQFLHEYDEPCPVCGYNLRNLTRSRCPECGKELELRVRRVGRVQVAWTIVLISSSAGAAVGALLGAVLVKDGFKRQGGLAALFGANPGPALMAAALLLLVPVAVLAIPGRRRFQRLRHGVRRWLAVGVAVYAAALVTLVAAWIISR